jgi:hypothetical protein
MRRAPDSLCALGCIPTHGSTMLICKDIWGALSAILVFIGSVSYVGSTIKGGTRPHAFSWFIWGISGTIVSAAQYIKHAGAGDWVIWSDVILCFVVAGLAARQGDKNVTRPDWLILSAALLAAPIWYATDTPLTAVVIIATIDFLGFVPTLRKSYAKPHDEKALSFGLYSAAFFASLLASENYNVATVLYPALMAACNFSMALMLLWRRKTASKQRQ